METTMETTADEYRRNTVLVMHGVEEGGASFPGPGDDEEEEDEENNFWWQRGLIQPPRCVVKWDHVDESRQSRGIAEKGRKVTWSELFLDLILVTNIGKLGEAYQAGELTLIEAVVCYRNIYTCWWSTTQYAGRFFSDDLIDKYCSTGLLMFLLLCAGLRIGDGSGFVATATCIAHATACYHTVMALVMMRVVVSIPSARKHMTLHGVYPSVAEALGNLLVPLLCRGRARLLVGLIVVAYTDTLWHGIIYNWYRLPKRERIPIHVDHLVERRGCLRLILFGEVVTGCTITPRGPLSARVLAPIALAFIVVLNMKLLAFDVDIVPLKRHCYRIGGYFRPWIYLEAAFLFDVSMAVAGSCVRIVLTIILATKESSLLWPRADQAHLLLCLCVATGVFCLTIERLMHDQSHLLGDHTLLSFVATPFRRLCRRRPDPTKTYDAIDLAASRATPSLSNQGLIFLFQLTSHFVVILVCVLLALYCESIDEDFEVTLVLACLATMTSAVVVINLVDEISIVTESHR